MPARMAPRKITGKSTVSSTTMATRSSRRNPEPAEKIGETRRLAFELRIGHATLAVDEGEFVAAAFAEVAVEQVARGVVDGHGAHRGLSAAVKRRSICIRPAAADGRFRGARRA